MALKSLMESFSYHLKDSTKNRQRYNKIINGREIILSFVVCCCAHSWDCDWDSAWEIGIVYPDDDVIIRSHMTTNTEIINVINDVESKFPDKIK